MLFERTYSGFAPGGRFLVRRQYNQFNLSIPHTISLVDLATGVAVQMATLPVTSVSQNTATAWR